MAALTENRLYYGDNLEILPKYVRDASVDLVYIDPPFNSSSTYNMFFGERDGRRSTAQAQAFQDTWLWDEDAIATYDATVARGGIVADALVAFKQLLGGGRMLAYLAMMAPRLVELRRVLKPSGSIYLHCDQTASHYLKLLMDAVFGPACFRNEVIWSYRRWPSPAKRYQRMHDVLLFYARTPDGPGVFNVQYEPNSASYERRWKGKAQRLDPDSKSRKLTGEAESRGLPRRDVWELPIIAGSSKERLGYPTQKPLALLERIISTSSEPGAVVLDAFCGCGTAVSAAHKLNRRWIGIDITYLAIQVIAKRLAEEYPGQVAYELVGAPVTLDEAEKLAADDKFQFQCWALSRAGAVAINEAKRGADRGIDGRLFFKDALGETRQIIFSVKGGQNIGPRDVRDLRGVIEREGAPIGALITLHEPTRAMRVEAAAAGSYEPPLWGTRHDRLQILTVADLLDGKQVDFPARRDSNTTIKRASRTNLAKVVQVPLRLRDADPMPEAEETPLPRPARPAAD
jgi:DNA modification methylase